MGTQQLNPVYEFDGFWLDAQHRLLYSGANNQPVQIASRALDTLLYMVERPGQILDKRTLLEQLWPNVVVEEGNLTQTIHTLRRILGERPEEHRFIVTVPGRGYQFVAAVNIRLPSEQVIEETATLRETERHHLKLWRWVALVAVMVATIAASLLLHANRQPAASRVDAPTPSIAVLPFVDMSPSGDQAYFSDGLSEEIINLLSQSAELRVIARTSSFSFRNKEMDIPAIAGTLNATHVLEGSVRRSTERMRVTAQLVDAKTAEPIWSETYDHDAQDVLAVQSDIAKSVADALNITLASGEIFKPAGKIGSQAQDRYLQGLYFWNRNGQGDVARARGYFEQAVQLDAAHARAWSGLAAALRSQILKGELSAEQGLPRQREAVERALSLDPKLAEVQLRSGQYFYDIGNQTKADRHLARAFALGPFDPQVLRVSSGLAWDAGRLGEALELQRRAVSVDPLSTRNLVALASTLMALERWEEAKFQLRKALELSPTSVDLHADLARILILQGRLGEALVETQALPQGPRRDQCLALRDYASGDITDADAAFARLIAGAGKSDLFGLVELYVAEVYAYRQNSDKAFKWLELARLQALSDGHTEPGWWTRMQMRLSPLLNSLHDDSRWELLVDRPWTGATTNS